MEISKKERNKQKPKFTVQKIYHNHKRNYFIIKKEENGDGSCSVATTLQVNPLGAEINRKGYIQAKVRSNSY